VRIRARIDELRSDPELVARAPHACLDEVRDAELGGDVPHVQLRIAAAEHGGA
jgi:hypothetical protein